MIVNIISVLAIALVVCIIPTTSMVYKKNIKFTTGVFIGTFLLLASYGCLVYSVSLANGYSIIDYTINSMFSELNGFYSNIPGIGDSDIAKIKAYLENIKNMYFILFPSMVVLTCLMFSYTFHMLVKGILGIFKKNVSGFNKFSELKMPKGAIFITVVSYLLSMIFESQRIGYGFLNLSSILMSVTAVCGLSIIDFWLRKKIKYSLVRVPIYCVGLLVLFILGFGLDNVLAIVGMADALWDFRNFKLIIHKKDK